MTIRLPVRGGTHPPVEIGAIYTVGLNYRDPAQPDEAGPERPLIYGKASSSLAGAGSAISWDRALARNVHGECELGVVIGAAGSVLGYTVVNDVTAQDAALAGDQWLLGKSMPGFCPVGPLVVPTAELDARDLRLTFAVNGMLVQDGRTSQMRFSIAEIVAYLGAYIELRPGDLIASGTPARSGPAAGRFLQPGDVMSATIEGIGELSNRVA